MIIGYVTTNCTYVAELFLSAGLLLLMLSFTLQQMHNYPIQELPCITCIPGELIQLRKFHILTSTPSNPLPNTPLVGSLRYLYLTQDGMRQFSLLEGEGSSTPPVTFNCMSRSCSNWDRQYLPFR
ncbi:hypothetical protein F4823DRAFT_610063 [Ustulina deusta]|nr:hypothetical protein F4823DRAFT_610063 [Ustulina deusta]